MTCGNGHCSRCGPAPDSPLEPTLAKWRRLAVAHTRFTLSPIASHGRWSGKEPFATDPAARDWPGPIAAITRARVRMRQWRAFQQAVPPVARILDDQPGLLYRIGIGGAPIGLQGTFSVWQDQQAVRDFAYALPPAARSSSRPGRPAGTPRSCSLSSPSRTSPGIVCGEAAAVVVQGQHSGADHLDPDAGRRAPDDDVLVVLLFTAASSSGARHHQDP